MTYHWPFFLLCLCPLGQLKGLRCDDVAVVIHIGFAVSGLDTPFGCPRDRGQCILGRHGSRFMGVPNLNASASLVPRKKFLTMHLSKVDTSLTPCRSFCSICAGFIYRSKEKNALNYKRPLHSTLVMAIYCYVANVNKLHSRQFNGMFLSCKYGHHDIWPGKIGEKCKSPLRCFVHLRIVLTINLFSFYFFCFHVFSVSCRDTSQHVFK